MSATTPAVERTQSTSEAEALVPPKDEESFAGGDEKQELQRTSMVRRFLKKANGSTMVNGVGALVAVFVLMFLVLLFQGFEDLLGSPIGVNDTERPCTDVKTCGPVIRVFIAWLVLYFAFLFFQSFQKLYLHNKLTDAGQTVSLHKVKYGEAGGRDALIGDRTVGNMM